VLRTDPELALTGRRCVPARLREAGYTFAYPELRPALAACLVRGGSLSLNATAADAKGTP
jgi:hypothetical protein